MSLLQPVNQQPKPPTKEEMVFNTVNRIKNMSRETYRKICETQKNGVQAVWEHPKLTPQEVMDGLGKEAGKAFQFHKALTEYIVAIATAEGIEPDILLPKGDVTINADGTATVKS